MIGPGKRTGMFWCRCGNGYKSKFLFKQHIAQMASVDHFEVREPVE